MESLKRSDCIFSFGEVCTSRLGLCGFFNCARCFEQSPHLLIAKRCGCGVMRSTPKKTGGLEGHREDGIRRRPRQQAGVAAGLGDVGVAGTIHGDLPIRAFLDSTRGEPGGSVAGGHPSQPPPPQPQPQPPTTNSESGWRRRRSGPGHTTAAWPPSRLPGGIRGREGVAFASRKALPTLPPAATADVAIVADGVPERPRGDPLRHVDRRPLVMVPAPGALRPQLPLTAAQQSSRKLGTFVFGSLQRSWCDRGDIIKIACKMTVIHR